MARSSIRVRWSANSIRSNSGPAVRPTINNSGTIISTDDDAIEFRGTGTHVVNNSGLLSALSTAILENGTGTVFITNSGTILGTEAILTNSGDDIVVNSGTMSGATLLNDGDDLFDSSLGFVNGRVNGGAGADTLIGGASGDRLEGSIGDDVLIGGDGNDVLQGGSGADDLDGGDGRDTANYSEFGTITVDLANPDANTGGAIGDVFTSIENLTGGTGADRLFGDAEHNTLRGGGGGSDTLDGRGGADVLIGGTGDDLYVVDTTRDRINELAAEGTDTVRSTVRFTLQEEVENLTLIGNGANSATGNAGANALVGNNAANVLDGLLGNDSITGGGGADMFRFDSPLDAATNVDTINDFLAGTDRIELNRIVFTELNGGAALQATRFFTGGAAHDATDRVIYNATTGALFYDADGTGANAQVLFAQIGAGLALTAGDFALVG